MKKTILSLLAGALFAYEAQAQATFDRAYAVGGSSTDYVQSSAVDATGNLYVAGSFEGTATFDETGASSLSSAGGEDIFVAKYAPSGALTWVKRVGSTGDDAGITLALDGGGNVYIGGEFEGTVDFDPNAGTQNLSSAGSVDAFLLKLDSNGDFVSVKHFGNTGYDQLIALAIDGSSNLYLAIFFENSIDSDPNAGTQTLTNSGLGSALVKLDASQNFVWSHALETGDGGLSIATNAAGDLYFSQPYYGLAIDLDKSAAVQAPLVPSAYNNGFWVAKWNTAGTFQWTKTVAAKSAYAGGIRVLNNGSVALAGRFRDSMDMDPSAALVLRTNAFSATKDNAVVLLLNSAGDYVSGLMLEPQNANSSTTIRSLSYDADDNIYFGGSYTGAVDFDPSAGTATDTGANTKSLPFVLKLSSAGSYLWHYASVDTTLGEVSNNVHVTNSPNAAHLYLVGEQTGALSFGTDTTAALGSEDIFIAKWSQTIISVERTEFAQMQLFPNPSFDGRVDIQLGELSAEIEATVFNGLGQQMSSTKHQNVEQLQVELPSAAGMYFIELRSQDGKRATLKAQRQ